MADKGELSLSVARRCGYCQQQFQPSPYRPQQTVCSQPECQRRRRSDYHRNKIHADPDYRQVCLDSPRKWRAQHSDYWRGYRETHPQAVEQNRRKQRDRDQVYRLTGLANNNLAFDLKSSPAKVYWIGPKAADLANNNLASGQVFVLEALVHQTRAAFASCKQQPSGTAAGSTG
jgi:hypothetical protein